VNDIVVSAAVDTVGARTADNGVGVVAADDRETFGIAAEVYAAPVTVNLDLFDIDEVTVVCRGQMLISVVNV